jgi:DNA repair exonuclease SbcCD ATPase subunit
VTRVFDGQETRVSVETVDGIFHGPAAEGRLIELIRPEAATATSPANALATALTQCVYLQQDLLRQFIDSVTEQERFNAVSELVGAGRITDLQLDLAKEKAHWTRATNTRNDESLMLRSRLELVESRLAEMKSRSAQTDGGIDESAWQSWWRRLREIGIGTSPVRMDSREAASVIDSVIKQLEVARRSAERRLQNLDALGRDLAGIASMPVPDLRSMSETVSVLTKRVEDAREGVSHEQARVTEVRRLQAELKEKSAQFRALATIALKQLEARCPVCDQEYDVLSTRRRLERIATASETSTAPPLPDALPDLLSTLAARERELSGAELALRTAKQASREYTTTELDIERRFIELGLKWMPISDRNSSVRDAIELTRSQVAGFADAQKAGELFALQLSRTGVQLAIQELQREREVTLVRLHEEEDEIKRRTATGDDAQKVIEALRTVALGVVADRVKEIEPLFRELYSRIDVHPAFRIVRFLASVVGGRGRLSIIVNDPVSGIDRDSPATVLSSSQMNALAVCAFLSLNLGLSQPPLEAAILDDPLQSLDDINLLGLVDLLRRTKDQRQLCVSTHDVRFGNLLERKLRPRSSEQRTIVIELDGWSRTGPVVTTREIKSDPVPIRLVGSETNAA